MSPTAGPEVTKVLNSGFIGQGARVEEFEGALRSYFNNDFCLSLNSGTSGLHLAYHLLKNAHESRNSKWPGLEPGDEVLTTALTCTASTFGILANNLKIKWVDVNPNTLNLDYDDLERKITSKTKIIQLVHWAGYPNDLDRVKQIQQKTKDMFGFRPAVIEDGAHSFGSEYKGKKIGTHGNLCMFSFQAIKHVTSVDGGLLIAPHMELYKRGKLIRWYGIDRENNRKDFRCEADIPEWGYKFHMNDVFATVGIENLKHADAILKTHRDNAAFFNQNLTGVPGVTLLDHGNPDYNSAYWIYTIKVQNRDGFIERMKQHGVACSRVHERNDKHTCVKEFAAHLPSLDKVVQEMVCIPAGWWVTPDDRQYILDCIKKGW